MVWGGQTAAGTMSNKTYSCVLPACGTFGTMPFNIPAAKGFMAWGSGSSLYSAGGFNDSFVAQASSEHLP